LGFVDSKRLEPVEKPYCRRSLAALKKDGWTADPASKGAIVAFIKYGERSRRVAIHYHPRKTYGPGLLKALLEDIGWTENHLRRLKLIKK
jgi:predicted RNA binding protein YcfA (HicA-like mRNA interferase family)